MLKKVVFSFLVMSSFSFSAFAGQTLEQVEKQAVKDAQAGAAKLYPVILSDQLDYSGAFCQVDEIKGNECLVIFSLDRFDDCVNQVRGTLTYSPKTKALVSESYEANCY